MLIAFSPKQTIKQHTNKEQNKQQTYRRQTNEEEKNLELNKQGFFLFFKFKQRKQTLQQFSSKRTAQAPSFFSFAWAPDQ